MYSLTISLVAISCVVILVAAAHADLQSKYPFSTVLFNRGDQFYELHWNFTRATETIYFAVNVSTTGWVGFGLSPTGNMIGSDVVIGWVNGEDTFFHDRFAEAESLPSIDPHQDWFLDNSEEEDGFTILEFSRNFTTCDDRDLDITISTARVIWSYSFSDPPNSTGEGAMKHDHRSSASINLLGGNPIPSNNPVTDDLFFDVEVSNVTIPTNSTTYWCMTSKLPPELATTTRYIKKVSPVISPHAQSFVHHLLVYLCPLQLSLTDEHVGLSEPCDYLEDDVQTCLIGLLFGAWAVGGEEFVYPEGVALPIGGVGTEQIFIIQMHYDNPNNIAGIVDNSGLRFYYTEEAPAKRAGVLYMGHVVNELMLVPPRTANYTIAGICSADCTRAYIPEEGITVFANALHTHVVGIGLTLEHYRYNSECNMLEELEPIDQNLRYDFNFQQMTHLPREHLILPGDILVLKCFYNTTENSEFVLGGESTLEEMCLSFLLYYPRPDDNTAMNLCISSPTAASFFSFFIDLQRIDPQIAARVAALNEDSLAALNELDWHANPILSTSLEDSILQSNVQSFCLREDFNSMRKEAKIPEVQCPYQTPSKCSTVQPQSCCEKTSGAIVPQVEIIMLFILSLLFVSIPTAY